MTGATQGSASQEMAAADEPRLKGFTDSNFVGAAGTGITIDHANLAAGIMIASAHAGTGTRGNQTTRV